MTEQVEQWNCIKFYDKLEHSSVETIEWFRRLQLWATGDWPLCYNNMPTHASCLGQSFFCETSNHPDNSVPLQPRVGTLRLLSFPQTIITFEREEISDHWWDSGSYDRVADGDWENCVRSQGACFEGNWGIIILCTMFLVSCIFLNRCLYFSHHWLDTFLTGLV